MGGEIDYSAVRTAVARGALEFFRTIRIKAGNDELIGLAVNTDEDVLGCNFFVDTKASLKKRLPPLSKKNLQELEKAGYTKEKFLFASRLAIEDWPFSSGKESVAVNKAIDAIWKRRDDEIESKSFDSITAGLLEAIAAGLKDFEEEADLVSVVDRNTFLLLAWISDSDDKRILKMAKQLNPSNLYKQFKSSWNPS